MQDFNGYGIILLWVGETPQLPTLQTSSTSPDRHFYLLNYHRVWHLLIFSSDASEPLIWYKTFVLTGCRLEKLRLGTSTKGRKGEDYGGDPVRRGSTNY